MFILLKRQNENAPDNIKYERALNKDQEIPTKVDGNVGSNYFAKENYAANSLTGLQIYQYLNSWDEKCQPDDAGRQCCHSRGFTYRRFRRGNSNGFNQPLC